MTVQASFPAVVALGMTLVVITGGIDLSVGSVFALGGVLAAWASPWGFFPALLVPLVVGGAFGLLNGLLIAHAGMAPFIVQNLINEIGSLNSSYQSVASGGFLIVVVVAQRYLARSRRTT